MSGIINKVKDTITPNHSNESNSSSTVNNGPHQSKLANKLDPRVDSDRDGRAAPSKTSKSGHGVDSTTHSSTHGPQTTQSSTTGGPHTSNVANKADPRVDSDRDNRARHEAIGGTHGHHSSNIANKADPRIDSDYDNREANKLAGTTGSGTTGTTHDTTTHGSTHGTTSGSGFDTNPNSTGAYGSTGNTYGTSGSGFDTNPSSTTHGTTGAYGSTGNTHGSNYGSTSTNAGPHDSNIANKVDPRVDSDRDNFGSHTGSTTTPHATGARGTYDMPTSTSTTATSSYNTPGTSSATAGPHDSKLANKVDPRIDSDLSSQQNIGTQRGF